MTTRKTYLDIAKIIACLAVITQHNVSLNIEGASWFIHYFYFYICRFAVPVFLMCTGVLLLNESKTITYRTIITKYVPRIFIPLIAIVYVMELTNSIITHSIDLTLLWKPLFNVFMNRVSVPYWYIYMIAGIYLMLPYIRKIIHTCTKRELEIFLLLFIFIRGISPFIDLFFRREFIMGIIYALQMSLFNGYIGYLILGYYLDKYINIRKRSELIICLFLNIFCILFPQIILRYHITDYQNVGNQFGDIFSPNIMIICITFFIVLKNVKIKSQKAQTFLVKISQSTFGIYILHVYILQIFALSGILTLERGNIWSIPFYSLLNFIISYIIVSLLQTGISFYKSTRKKIKLHI